MVGGQVEEAHYNGELYAGGAGIFPVQLGGINGDETEQKWAGIEVEEAENPAFALFTGDGAPLLSSVKIFRWWQLEGITAVSNVQIVAKLSDENRSPLFVQKRMGKGHICVYAIPADTDWCNWPEDASYLVSMQEMTRGLARRESAANSLLAGEPIRHRLDLSSYRSEVGIELPGGGRATTQAVTEATEAGQAAGGVAEYTETRQRGIYQLETEQVAGPSEKVVYVVNIDPGESDLARAEQAEVERSLGDATVRFVDGSQALAGLTGDSSKNELWKTILMVLVGLLFAEQGLAYLFGKRR